MFVSLQLIHIIRWRRQIGTRQSAVYAAQKVQGTQKKLADGQRSRSDSFLHQSAGVGLPGHRRCPGTACHDGHNLHLCELVCEAQKHLG